MLFSFAILGIYSPFAGLYSWNALILLQDLFPHPLWTLLSRYYKKEAIPNLKCLSISKNAHSLFLLQLSKEILQQTSSTTLVQEIEDLYPELKNCSSFQPFVEVHP